MSDVLKWGVGGTADRCAVVVGSSTVLEEVVVSTLDAGTGRIGLVTEDAGEVRQHRASQFWQCFMELLYNRIAGRGIDWSGVEPDTPRGQECLTDDSGFGY
ncbi:hypothetical protein BBD46_00025 [Natrialba sp. SSL1]|nr:hypothetical protein [Natrialba sp. SSL1]OIB59112.1 hypothetical protein BBD46_00025 [Natrialba sp. SSL1]